MDAELLKSLSDYTQENSRVTVLPADETSELATQVARHFGFSMNGRWWWEELPKAGATSISYTSGEDGLGALLKVIPEASQHVLLFVTDDEPPPWPCIGGAVGPLVAMLRQQRFFEYFIVDSTMQWIVFDTHHNQLIVFGEGLRRSK
jgi:hypothetical protein